MDASDASAMDSIVSRMHDAWVAAAAAAGAPSTRIAEWLYGSNVNLSYVNQNALQTASEALDELEHEKRDEVLAGELSFDGWNGRAQAIWDIIRSVDGSLASYDSLSAYWDKTVVPTASGVASALKDLAPNLALGGAAFLLVVAVLSLVFLAQLSPVRA